MVRVGATWFRAQVSLRDFPPLLSPPPLSLSALPDVFINTDVHITTGIVYNTVLNCAGNSSTKMELGGQPKPRTAKNMGDKKVTSANVVITSTQQDVIALNGQHTFPYYVPLSLTACPWSVSSSANTS